MRTFGRPLDLWYGEGLFDMADAISSRAEQGLSSAAYGVLSRELGLRVRLVACRLEDDLQERFNP